MTDTVRARKIIAALLAKTVARGATPGEEAAARAKAEQLALKYGVPLHDPYASYVKPEDLRRYGFNPRRAADPASDLFRGFAEAMQRELDAAAIQRELDAILRRAEASAERRRREAAAAREQEAARERKKSGLAQQPAMARLLAYLGGRPKSISELAMNLDLSQHTVRGMISRLKADGVKIRRFKSVNTGKIHHGF